MKNYYNINSGVMSLSGKGHNMIYKTWKENCHHLILTFEFNNLGYTVRNICKLTFFKVELFIVDWNLSVGRIGTWKL